MGDVAQAEALTSFPGTSKRKNKASRLEDTYLLPLYPGRVMTQASVGKEQRFSEWFLRLPRVF